MKQLSEQAQVAKLCRKFLKENGIKGKCTSESFAGGDAVNIELLDATPEQAKKAIDEFEKYKKGHFDGMTDYYHLDNLNRVIPQTKYLIVEQHFSDSLKEKAKEHLKTVHDVSDDESAQRSLGCWFNVAVCRVLFGSLDCEEFWGE